MLLILPLPLSSSRHLQLALTPADLEAALLQDRDERDGLPTCSVLHLAAFSGSIEIADIVLESCRSQLDTLTIQEFPDLDADSSEDESLSISSPIFAAAPSKELPSSFRQLVVEPDISSIVDVPDTHLVRECSSLLPFMSPHDGLGSF